MSLQEDNESARSFAWLTSACGLSDPGGLVAETWREVRGRMRPVDQAIVLATDWISDPWLCRGVKPTGLTNVAPEWDPPEKLDDWPMFAADRLVGTVATDARRTQPQTLRSARSEPPDGASADADAAIARFLEMESEIRRQGDARMVQGEHLRAWLATSVSPLLRGVMLTPGIDPSTLAQVTLTRLAVPLSLELPRQLMFANDLEAKRIELLYNLTVDATGAPAPLDPADVRVGQGEPWRENWAWLSQDIGFAELREAVRLTARIMRCAPVVEGLTQALGSARSELRTIALAVLRRWLLALKSMSWLEASTLADWDQVRAQDLACFAFSALKPDWPRRILAVSHRSADAKPILRTMRLWRSSRCALDATYVPSWETNTGMVWGLFAATPAIVRVHSPAYADSLWCRREAELAEYLVTRGDFVAGRWVLDIDVERLRSLDGAYAVWDGGADDDAFAEPGLFREFPPLVQVWTPPPMPAWDVAMLRAGAALRAINALIGDAELVNRIVESLLLGEVELPVPAPTNNPTGWREYAHVFGELQAQLGDDSHEPAMSLPASYGDADARLDRELLERVPDLSGGTPALGDVLVALEFLRTEWRIAVDEGRGRFMALNCRELSRELLLHDERLSLYRGLLSVRLPIPLWLIQTAGQGMERWALPGDFPIFTEYLDNQFSWMLEIFVDRRVAQSRFPEDSGLAFSPALRRLCREGR